MVSTLKLLKFGKNGSLPSHEDRESVASQLAHILEQAQHLGQAHAREEEQRGISWGSGTGSLSAAWNIVNRFVDRIASWFRSSDVEDLTDEDVTAEVETLAETVAGTEIAEAIEQAVLDELQAQDVMQIVWIAQPGACKLCQANADQGPIPLGGEFASGDAKPPLHPHCRCSLGMPGEE